MRPTLLPLVLLLLCPASAARSDAVLLPDSTTIERWQLENGLDVVVRHVPGARPLAVTLAFRAGAGDDPGEQPGLARLLAHCWFFGGAGDRPARTPEQMASLRPEGWDFRVDRETAAFAEVTTAGKLAGVLDEFARRLARPTITEATLAEARERMRRETSERWFGDAAQMLHYRVRAFAEGIPDADILRESDRRVLDKLRPSDVVARLADRYVPANGVLVLVGDLERIEVRPLVSTLFAGIPGGQRQPRPAAATLIAGRRDSRAAGLPEPACAIALFAPALDDTTHPSFLLNALLIGSALQQGWGPPRVGRTRFSYSVLDEPDLLRIYPPVPAGGGAADAAGVLDARLEELRALLVTADDLELAREHFRWLLGGPMSAPVLSNVRSTPGAILQVGMGEAQRTLGRGPEFWARYRERFDANERDPRSWMPWFLDPAQRAVLVIQPQR